ncbi:MAG: choice-of-anchor F family protein [Pseudomonadota bacterium]|nr:choice-of-anchor F family protein [Pseudomonadota bacterium]
MKSNWKHRHWPISLVSSIALMSALSVAQAGVITSLTTTPYAPNALEFEAVGFGGWNLDNVTVNILDGTFNYTNGSYEFGLNADGTYSSDVDDGAGNVMATIIAKPWPIGEPPGVKVINDDLAVKNNKPVNCIIATSYLEGHYLDSVDPQQVICSSGFQTHKRYKQAMLPSMVDGIGSESADMVFNVEAEAGSRDYQVFQKINNWTDSRLEGFTIEAGFGVGAGFVNAESLGLVSELSLSVPGDVWRDNQLATFSHGLFGAPDKHFPEPGFFDNTSAGYFIDEYPVASGVTDTLTATTMLPGNYSDVPPGGLADGQFGPWLPNIWLPQGIFFDTDGNPDTDAELVAWYGYNPNPDTSGFGWMSGDADGFQAIADTVIEGWASDLAYSMGEIDDLVNVGLNYIVTIGDVSQFPGTTFTIRITPTKDTSGTGIPGYVGVPPNPPLLFTSRTGVISLSPSAEFLIGDALTVRVGDADMNLDPNAVDSLAVQATSSSGLNEAVILTEEGEDRGVFVAGLPASFSNVQAGTDVTVTYIDLDDGLGGTNVPVTATSTATDVVTTPSVEITKLQVPTTIFTGATKKVTVTLVNNSSEPESGHLTLTANDVVELDFVAFTLDPGKREKFTINWTAPDSAQTVNWEATVDLDSGGAVTPATATTEVRVKGKP